MTPSSRRVSIISAVIAVAMMTTAQAQSASRRDQLIVTADWLSAHLRDPDLVLLQTGSEADFNAGHIPGAQRVKTWRNKPADADGFNEMGANGLTLEMLPDADFQAILARHGITDRSRVIVYFTQPQGLTSTTRLMLALERAGFGDRISLLQGGLPAWKRDGRPLSAEPAMVKPAATPSLRLTPVIVDAAFVQASAGKADIALVDTREPAVYDGVPGANRAAPDQTPGHLPGALNLPHEVLYDSDGVLKPADELRAAFAAAGVKPGVTVVAYCYTGQRATAVMLAAATLGHKTVLYDGSAEDWAARKLPFTKTTK